METVARAAYVLRGNDRGTLTVAAPRLYPHMWSWDAAFIAIGLARVSTGRALTDGAGPAERHGLFAEYYHPFTGAPLGARRQSWTAAVALDLLAR